MINLYADDTTISATYKNTKSVTIVLYKHLALPENTSTPGRSKSTWLHFARALRHPLPSSSITNLTAPHSSTDQESPQPIATQIARTALADDCVIHCPAHPHHHNSNFSTINQEAASHRRQDERTLKLFMIWDGRLFYNPVPKVT
ncbi:hypothetical protein TNCV_1254861 [Trichonephila clavipes]|nr:hypothetical protein TNCV_1254861 [Trichonephila clavipes]